MYSYHIFYFPFKWEINGRENMLFADQTNLDTIDWNKYTNWLENPVIPDEQELNELYNEKNYYYEFVHPVLYDNGKKNSIIKHFERKEPQQRDISYIISKKNGKTYTLKVEAMNLNLYATGVGMLTFYLMNDRDDQKEPEDILIINQYGRRIFPPFMADLEYRGEIAEFISIEGLNGEASDYYEDFSGYTHKEPWKPACFINHLITDLYEGIKIAPVIDDRMFVSCTYSCQKLIESFDSNSEGDNNQSIIENENAFNKFYLENDFWYKYVFVDSNWPTCQNKKMKDKLLEEQTYTRWQKYGTLYGISRYSLVMLMGNINSYNDFLPVHMRTIYARMVELVLIQRASTLRFSGEITRVSRLSKDNKVEKEVIEQISSLYKEYIRFINQVHFREVTTQDQGIELYDLMTETLKIKEYVQDLDNEIEELYQYVNILDDKIRNRNASNLNILATVLLPVTVLAALFSMNAKNVCCGNFWMLVASILVVAAMVSYLFILFLIKKKK